MGGALASTIGIHAPAWAGKRTIASSNYRWRMHLDTCGMTAKNGAFLSEGGADV